VLRGAIGLSIVFAVSFAALLYLTRPESPTPVDPQAHVATPVQAGPSVEQPATAMVEDEPESAAPSVVEELESTASDESPVIAEAAEAIVMDEAPEEQLAEAGTNTEEVDALLQVLRSDAEASKRIRAFDQLLLMAERDSDNSSIRSALDDARHDDDATLAEHAEEAYDRLAQE
jgi:hypothetical protein